MQRRSRGIITPSDWPWIVAPQALKRATCNEHNKERMKTPNSRSTCSLVGLVSYLEMPQHKVVNMRRKREKGATTKAKPSPEKKPEKLRRTRSKRRKQSTSDNDSDNEIVQAPDTVSVTEQNAEETCIQEKSPEDSQDQVWQVKTAEGTGDEGDIKKLKICLTRPPLTPESCDKSPKSKRRHTRATSLSDTASIEGSDEKKKIKHRSKWSISEVSETSEKKCSPQPNDSDQETNVQPEVTNVNVGIKADEEEPPKQIQQSEKKEVENVANVDNVDKEPIFIESETKISDESCTQIEQSTTVENTVKDEEDETNLSSEKVTSPERKRSMSIDKSEILEIHAEESKIEISEHGITESQKEDTMGEESNGGMTHIAEQ
ncbi:unnamed protein product, partial [Iphiclides podalirius]